MSFMTVQNAIDPDLATWIEEALESEIDSGFNNSYIPEIEGIVRYLDIFYIESLVVLSANGEVNAFYFSCEEAREALTNQQAYDTLFESVLDSISYNDTFGYAVREYIKSGLNPDSYESFYVHKIWDHLERTQTFFKIEDNQQYVNAPLNDVW